MRFAIDLGISRIFSKRRRYDMLEYGITIIVILHHIPWVSYRHPYFIHEYILLRWSIYFINISSSFLLFVISLCSDLIPLKLDSGYNVRHDTPNFLGLGISNCRRRAHYIAFSVVIRSWIFFSSNLFPALAASLDLSSRYVSLILVMFLLREYYYPLLFVLRCIRVVG